MSFFSKNPRRIVEKGATKKAMQQITDRTAPHQRAFGDPYMHVFEQTISNKLGGVPVLAERKITGALSRALKTLGVGPGDEVIVPALCSFSNISPILQLGAVPVFVDINLDDCAIDPSKIEEKITERTKVIIVVHLFGQPTLRISEILKIAKRKSLPIIENANQVFMAKIKIDNGYRLAGTLGDIGYFGFLLFDVSVLVFQRNGTLYDKAKKLKIPGAPNILYEDHMIRFLARLKSIDHRLEQRKKIAEYYTEQLGSIQEIILPKKYENVESVWYHYIIRTKRSAELFEYLSQQGVKSVYKPTAYFSDLQRKQGIFPVSERVVAEAILLPILSPHTFYPCTIEDAVLVTKRVKEFFQE